MIRVIIANDIEIMRSIMHKLLKQALNTLVVARAGSFRTTLRTYQTVLRNRASLTTKYNRSTEREYSPEHADR